MKKNEKRISKIRITDKNVEITYDLFEGMDTHAVVLKSEDEPLPAFRAALQKLSQTVINICGLDSDYLDGLTVRGLSLIYKGGEERRNVTIHAVKSLEDVRRPLNIHTPLMAAPDDDEDASDEGATLTDADVRLIDAVIKKAEEYMAGKRAPKPEQLQLVS